MKIRERMLQICSATTVTLIVAPAYSGPLYILFFLWIFVLAGRECESGFYFILFNFRFLNKSYNQSRLMFERLQNGYFSLRVLFFLFYFFPSFFFLYAENMVLVVAL